MLGYCIFPIVVSAIVTVSMKFFLPVWIKFIFVVAGVVWSSFCSVGYLAGLTDSDKKAIVIYPVVLFYMFLSWFVMLN